MMRYPHDHDNDIIFFARTNYRNSLRKFGIRTKDRRRHMYVIGKSGVGKTTMLENMMLADVYYGHGMGLLDPHGDSAEKIIESIPDHRINDVVYFNPADQEHCIGFNILESVAPEQRHLVASGLMGVFKKIWPDVWSARMEHIMNNTLLSLLENPGNTLLSINRTLTDRDFRRKIIAGVQDPVVKAFWITEFEQWDDKYRTEAVAPIQNKVGQFLSTSIIRNIVAQEKSTINVREIMDSNKLFIVNLSKGRIGEDASRLLGGLLVTKMQLAAMARVDTPEPERQDFYLYIDEFQNFATDSFATILSEARKYRLCLIMAHQYIEQLEESVRAAVFGNAGTIASFRVGATDAPVLAVEFAPKFGEEDLVNLPMANIYLRLLCNGISTDPFSAVTLPPIHVPTNNAEAAIAASRAQYAVDRPIVEERILRWSESKPQMDESKVKEVGKGASGSVTTIPKEKPKKAPPWMHEYNCSRCDKYMQLPVELDRSRPIYCEDCIEIVREERRSAKKKAKGKKKGDTPKKSTAPKDVTEVIEKPVAKAEISLSALGSSSDDVPKPKLPTSGPSVSASSKPNTSENPESETSKLDTTDKEEVTDNKKDQSNGDGAPKKKRRRRRKKKSSSGNDSKDQPKSQKEVPTKTPDNDDDDDLQSVTQDSVFPW